jgi:hypothetical protein
MPKSAKIYYKQEKEWCEGCGMSWPKSKALFYRDGAWRCSNCEAPN